MSLLNKTIKLMEREDLTELAKKTGYSYQWLWQVTTGITKSPNFQRIERIHKMLSKKKAK